jgi:hypothetical protein
MRQVINFFWKIKMFFVLAAWKEYGFDYWRKEVWERDPDGRYCCDGYMCGCGGATVRGIFERHGEAI